MDIIVGFHRRSYLIEIKDGEKFPSKRKLTDGEQEFWDKWKGGVYLIESRDDVIDFVNKTGRFELRS